MASRRTWATVVAITAACALVWFTYVNVGELFGAPYFGFKENMDKFSYPGLVLFLVIEVTLLIVLVIALRVRRRAHS